MAAPIRVGIVGSRYAAEFHYEAYQRVTGLDVTVVGVTSVTRENREKFAKERGINAFRSVDEMLPEVDVVDNCTPGHAHEPVSIAAFEAGKHVVVEKPFTGYYGPPGDTRFKGNTFSKEKMLDEAVQCSSHHCSRFEEQKKALLRGKLDLRPVGTEGSRGYRQNKRTDPVGSGGSVPLGKPFTGVWDLEALGRRINCGQELPSAIGYPLPEAS